MATTVTVMISKVRAMKWAEIAKDKELKNALSKALGKSKNKDQFAYLSDTCDPYTKFVRYIQKDNKVNISAKLKAQCEAASNDKAALKKLLDKTVHGEAMKLMGQALRGALQKSVAFKAYVDLQNRPEVQARAKKAAKKLGIQDVKTFTAGMVAQAEGDTGTAKKLLAKVEKAENLRSLQESLTKDLKAMGLAA